MYNAIWLKLFEIIPELRNNVTGVTLDFEKAAIRSAKECFREGTRISGCFFHFKQVSNKHGSYKNRDKRIFAAFEGCAKQICIDYL